MSTKTFTKALLGAAISAAVVAAPQVQASAYGYGTFQLQFFTFEAEYAGGPNGTPAWTRPGSHNLPGSGANFTSGDNSNNVSGGTSQSFSDSVTFDTHIPPSTRFGVGVPVDATQAFINISGAADPGQNVYGQTGGGRAGSNGSYIRADAIWSQLGGQIGSFGNGESAGEADAKVAEGYLATNGAVEDANSISSNTFRGQVDFSDKTLDSGGGEITGDWTGRVRARFDYESAIDALAELEGDSSTATYSFGITLSEIRSATGNLVTNGNAFGIADNSSRGGFTSLDFNRSITVQGTAIGSQSALVSNTGSAFVVWNLADLVGVSLANLNNFWQIDIANGAETILKIPAPTVPVPATLALFGTALFGMGASIRRRRKAAAKA